MVNTANYTWTQLNAEMGFARDGVHGAFIGSTHHIFGGWSGGSTTSNNQYTSPNGVTWTAGANAPWTGRHTCAYCQVGNTVYMVNGDYYNLANDGALSKESWSFNGTTWTQITADNGLGPVIFGALVHLNGDFYYIGGQTGITAATIRPEVWKSTNNCLSFSKIADTPFKSGLLVGNVCVFNNKIWKVCGSRYDDTAVNRTYPRKIYSSTNGITWTYEGKIPYAMRGRHYSQLVVFDNIMWMIGGFNSYYGLRNIDEVWASDNGTDWYHQSIPWEGRHACTAWVGNDGIYMGHGTIDSTAVVSDIWKMTLNP